MITAHHFNTSVVLLLFESVLCAGIQLQHIVYLAAQVSQCIDGHLCSHGTTRASCIYVCTCVHSRVSKSTQPSPCLSMNMLSLKSYWADVQSVNTSHISCISAVLLFACWCTDVRIWAWSNSCGTVEYKTRLQWCRSVFTFGLITSLSCGNEEDIITTCMFLFVFMSLKFITMKFKVCFTFLLQIGYDFSDLCCPYRELFSCYCSYSFPWHFTIKILHQFPQ